MYKLYKPALKVKQYCHSGIFFVVPVQVFYFTGLFSTDLFTKTEFYYFR